MARLNYPLTIDELITEALKAKAKFGGDKYILISNDEEGNGYHECYFPFDKATDFIDTSVPFTNFPDDLKLEDCVVLG